MKTILLAMLVVAQAAWAGQLRIGTARVNGDQVTVPIMLDGDVGKGVSTLDFHLKYDPALFEPLTATAGKAASDADKSVQANQSAKGEYVVIMMGLNQNTVTSGEVANVVLRKVGTSDSGKANLSVSQTTFASPEGVNIPSQGDQGVIQLSGKTSDTAPGQSNTSGSTTTSAQSTSSPGKDTTSTTSTKTGTSAATGGVQTGTSKTTGAAAGTATTLVGSQALASTVAGAMGRAGAGGGDSRGLAAAVKRVDAAHSALQEQTAGTPNAGVDGTPAPGASPQVTPENAETTEGLDKTPGVGGTMKLAKVVTPDGVRQGEKKDLEKSESLVVQSGSAKKSDSGLGLKVALGGVVVVVLGAVFVIRRKLFT